MKKQTNTWHAAAAALAATAAMGGCATAALAAVVAARPAPVIVRPAPVIARPAPSPAQAKVTPVPKAAAATTDHVPATIIPWWMFWAHTGAAPSSKDCSDVRPMKRDCKE